jgi:flagellar motor switch protein FliN/FliY
MTKDFLSQDEIDALLRQGVVESNEDNTGQHPEEELSDFERDALGEIGNISLGTAATALSTLLRQKVEITTPSVSLVRRSNLQNDLPLPHVVIKVDYTDGFVGANVLAIQVRDAQVIADLMLGGDGNVTSEELNELHMSAVAEAMNQMMGSAATSMSTIFNMMVNITPPAVSVLTLDESHALDLFPSDEILVKISFRLLVGNLIDSNMMQLVPISFAKTMLAKLTGYDNTGKETPAPSQAGSSGGTSASQPTPAPAYQQPTADVQAPAYQTPPTQPQPTAYGMPPVHPQAGYGTPSMQQPPQNGYGMMGGGAPHPGHNMQPAYHQPSGYGMPNTYGTAAPVHVQPAQFGSFSAADPSVGSSGNMNLLLDIPLQVTVELGRTRKQIRDILELGPGAIIELDKLAGEPVDILVNNKLVAKGEVVVIDENFGVRVTDILSPAERIAKLQ